MMVRYQRVGGLRFLRVGRVQLSWCVVSRATVARQVARAAEDALIADYLDRRARRAAGEYVAPKYGAEDHPGSVLHWQRMSGMERARVRLSHQMR